MLSLTTLEKYLPDALSMTRMGELLARALVGNKVLIFLQGELGAGKTTLARGFLGGLGYDGRVKSPTYTLVESYEAGGYTVYHFDFYRINEPAELEFIGLGDYLSQPALCLIEWPELAGNMLPDPDLVLRIKVQDQGRSLEIEATSTCGQETMEYLKHAAAAL